MGVDTIISTVTGAPQMELLKAAVEVGVRRFAPAEFEGTPVARSSPDPLDRDKSNIRGWLDYYRNEIQSTIFSCGVLYERFARGGLHRSRMALNIPYGDEGDYLISPRNLEANIPENSGDVTVCMTAAHDVARLVVRAISMDNWPRELTMVGERLTVRDIIKTVLRVRGKYHVNPAHIR
jgi:nucleoside-diphosphate-sugar epimerase